LRPGDVDGGGGDVAEVDVQRLARNWGKQVEVFLAKKTLYELQNYPRKLLVKLA